MALAEPCPLLWGGRDRDVECFGPGLASIEVKQQRATFSTAGGEPAGVAPAHRSQWVEEDDIDRIG